MTISRSVPPFLGVGHTLLTSSDLVTSDSSEACIAAHFVMIDVELLLDCLSAMMDYLPWAK